MTPELGPGPSYTVTLEPGFHEWLYTLPVARVEREDVRSHSAYLWLPLRPLSGRLSYRAHSDLDSPRPERYPESLLRNRALPGGGNPRARELAAQWRNLDSPRQRLQAGLDYLRSQPFVYTLNPPLLGEDNVDAFLFDSQQGFCEHFAGSFAFLMRAAGVPARLVVGYQGGEFNRQDNYLLVHQLDAHAWVEVWLPEAGWQRVDPTAAVAPGRIRMGAEALMREQGSYLADDPLSLRRFAWATQLRYFFDNINYAWARWVLNYDEQRQWQLLRNLLGEVSPLRMVVLVALVGGVPLAWLALSALRLPARRSEDPASRAYLRCCRALARRGVTRRPEETPQAFLVRVRQEAPQWSAWLTKVTEAYIASSYRRSQGEQQDIFRKRLQRLHRPYKNSL